MICVVAAALLFLAVSIFDVTRYFSLDEFTPGEAAWTLMIFGWAVIAGFYVEPFSAVVGAVRGAGIPNFLSGACKVLEIAGIMVALHFNAGPMAVAAIILAAVIVNVCGNLLFALHAAPWLSFREGVFDRDTIARLFRPAFGFFCISICINIFYVQAPRLIVFHGFGAAALASFTIFVTYTRAARNVICMIPQSAQVEMSRLYAAKEIPKLRRMIEGVAATTATLAAVTLLAAVVLAPIVIPIWTHGHVAIQWDLLIVLALISLVGCYFDPLLVAASAMNRMTLISLSYALGLLLGIGSSLLLLSSVGLAVIAGLCMLPAELAGVIAGRRSVEREVNKISLGEGALSLLRSTIPALLRR
jgi:O-antigen/teichoic acid export membrane protein